MKCGSLVCASWCETQLRQHFPVAIDNALARPEKTLLHGHPADSIGIGNFDLPTAERALLIRKKGDWQTLFPGDKKVDRDDVFSTLASAPGDIHATEGSQNWMSPQELQAIAAPSVFVPTHHRKIIVQEESLRSILEFLAK